MSSTNMDATFLVYGIGCACVCCTAFALVFHHHHHHVVPSGSLDRAFLPVQMAISRLPTTVRPVTNDMILRIDLEINPPSFSGVLDTTLQVVQSTQLLVFHAGLALSLGSAFIVSASLPHNPAQEAAYRSYDSLSEQMTSLRFQARRGK